jgi:hypothetical protein
MNKYITDFLRLLVATTLAAILTHNTGLLAPDINNMLRLTPWRPLALETVMLLASYWCAWKTLVAAEHRFPCRVNKISILGNGCETT